MRGSIRPLTRTLLAAVLATSGLGLATNAASATSPAPDPRADLPDGVPAAALRAEPRLATPRGWPFAQALSHTSGTNRLHDGATYWSDFVYDDKGAAIPSGLTLDNVALLAPYQGVYSYPSGSGAHGNGADIFVAAAGADARASYWRVDWNTLTDPDTPLAVWTFDTDGRAATGSDTWPASAGLTSPGMERALVVSSRGAWLHDLRSGSVTDVARRGGSLSVDRSTRSFVVRVPRTLLPVSGRWTVRLAAGLASTDGTSLAVPSISGLPALGLPRVYNVAFRSARQEPPVFTSGRTSQLVSTAQALLAASPLGEQLGADGQARFVTGNFWSEDHQADALATGDVTAFRHTIDWARLARKPRTGEPLVRGSSNRWYASRIRLGQGVVANSGGPTNATGDGRPNFLGRIQPYAVYVPREYRTANPAPLTWILHSLSVNHNQYAAYDPFLLQQLCERRGSICASTLGFGPDGWYFDEAEADYWSVWSSLARDYSLDERRTVLSGYSMGGWAAYHLGLSHPDLYAAAIALAGPPQCGVSIDGDALTMPAFGGRCTSDGTSKDLIGNARWLPYLIGQGTADQLVPFTSVEEQVSRFDALGLRHRFVRYPGEDHLIFATQDRFETVVEGLGSPVTARRPRDVDYTWRPRLTRADLGIGTTTAYWLRSLGARSAAPGSLARVRATSHALPGRAIGVVRTGPTPVTGPLPAIKQELGWSLGSELPRRQRLDLELTNVGRLAVDMRRAGLRCGVVHVSSDGPVRLRLTRLPGGDRDVLVTSDRTLRLTC